MSIAQALLRAKKRDRKMDFHLDQIFVGTKKRVCNEEFVERQLSSLLSFVAGTPRYFFALMVLQR